VALFACDTGMSGVKQGEIVKDCGHYRSGQDPKPSHVPSLDLDELTRDLMIPNYKGYLLHL
jgi:hypothetical protein